MLALNKASSVLNTLCKQLLPTYGDDYNVFGSGLRRHFQTCDFAVLDVSF